MWKVANNSPFQAGGTWLVDAGGVDTWVVTVKATYDIGGGGPGVLAKEQLPIVALAEYHGEAASSSMRSDGEISLPRGGTDVVLNAVAHAPGRRPAPSVPVTLELGTIRKQLSVFGARTWMRGAFGLTPSAPEPFVVQPIVYEHALGGQARSAEGTLVAVCADNPVGVGYGPLKRAGLPAPTITYSGEDDAPKRTAGYGALAPHWSPRREAYGTFDDAWQRQRAPLLPADYSEQAERCAPLDQRLVSYLDKPLAARLTNLTPNGRCDVVLEPCRVRIIAWVSGEKQVAHARLALVFIEPHENRYCLIYQHWVAAKAGQESLGSTTVEVAS